jgi:hypothetical protein
MNVVEIFNTIQKKPGAYLVFGPKSANKKDFLLNFIAKQVCNNKNNDFCGICKSCILWASNTHPDVYILSGEEGGAISIDQVRALSAFGQTQPQIASMKEVLILAADNMSLPAAQALLKLLEEPQVDLRYWLVAEDPESLLATILSRCQRYYIPSIELANNYTPKELDIFSDLKNLLNGKLSSFFLFQKINAPEIWVDSMGYWLQDLARENIKKAAMLKLISSWQQEWLELCNKRRSVTGLNLKLALYKLLHSIEQIDLSSSRRRGSSS